MSVIVRASQAALLVRPLIRASTFGPVLIGGPLAAIYVFAEATETYIDYRILVLRIAAVLICLAAAFVLDDGTEDTLTSVPTPLLLRRLLRIVLVMPVAAVWWFACVAIIGDVPDEMGGPLPTSDLTVEAGALFGISLAASCLGAKLASDRLGGIVAAPIVLVGVAVAAALPGDYRLILSHDALRWEWAHDVWADIAWGAAAAIVYLSLDRGRYPVHFRLRRIIGAAFARARPGTSGPTS